MPKYRMIQDPGHGWLEVPLAELEALGIKERISGYSYVNGDNAYLEEDCDLSVFLVAKAGEGNMRAWFGENVTEVYQERTPIRGYRHFAAI